MIYRVRHVTRYAYGAPVDLASHMLHLQPRSMPGQRVISAAITADPVPDRVVEGIDHYGNGVTWMFLDRPHPGFAATLKAEIEVDVPPPPAPEATLSWEAVVSLAAAGGPAAWDVQEFVFGSPMAPADRLAGAWAAASFPSDRPILSALLALNARFKAEFSFRSGVTHLHTSVVDVLRRREGVCQDFSHLMIAGLRSLGVPARYVSGYLRTRPPPGGARRLGADQSHAWVSAWLGPQHGWVMLDPTNNLVVKDEHVVLGWGRDYGDVSPVRGVILGGGEHTVSVAVELEPVEA